MFARQKGIALITVMLIVALASILATKMSGKLMVQMQRTVNITSNQQAYWYAIGAEAFAKSVLAETFKDEPDVTHLDQFWSQGETSYPVDYGEITGEISDLQSCFNLNALKQTNPDNTNSREKPQSRKVLEALITSLEIDGVGEFEAEYMADALTDWLDSNSDIASAGGAEDNDYAGKEFPYLPANNYLASVSELRVIEHFTAQVITELKPYVCVLPNTNMHQININTIDEESAVLLQALLGTSRSDAESILSERDEDGFSDVGEFLTLPSVAAIADLSEEAKQQFVVDSNYFTLKTMASFNDSYFNLKTVFAVDNQNNIEVVVRAIGRD